MVVIRDNAASATWLLENWCLVFLGNYLCYNFASNFFCGELTKNFQSVFAAVHICSVQIQFLTLAQSLPSLLRLTFDPNFNE